MSEGGNLTISIDIKKWEEDPQVLVFRLKFDSSREPISQMICHNGGCTQKYWRPGVSLMSESENVTLILMNVSYNQTGLYEIRKHSNKRFENKIYNVTVYRKYYMIFRSITHGLMKSPAVLHHYNFTG